MQSPHQKKNVEQKKNINYYYLFLLNCTWSARKTWTSRGQWKRPTSNDGYSVAKTETDFFLKSNSILKVYLILIIWL